MRTKRSWGRRTLVLLALGGPGCSVAGPDGELASRSQPLELASEAASSVSGSSALDSDPSECNCIIFPPSELATCPAERLFCNSSADCFCDSVLSAGEAAGLAHELALRAARSPRAVAASAPKGELLAAPAEAPPPGCSCLAGTPSAPEGGCAPEDWYCKPSGACRCDN